jgi:hypothetical protein
MRLIQKKQIKILKLCLISPLLEQATNLLYLVCLPIIIFIFLHMPDNLINYDVNKLARDALNEKNFKNITSPDEFINYIQIISKQLYTKDIPVFIPIGAIRLKRFSINNNCPISCTESGNNR